MACRQTGLRSGDCVGGCGMTPPQPRPRPPRPPTWPGPPATSPPSDPGACFSSNGPPLLSLLLPGLSPPTPPVPTRAHSPKCTAPTAPAPTCPCSWPPLAPSPRFLSLVWGDAACPRGRGWPTPPAPPRLDAPPIPQAEPDDRGLHLHPAGGAGGHACVRSWLWRRATARRAQLGGACACVWQVRVAGACACLAAGWELAVCRRFFERSSGRQAGGPSVAWQPQQPELLQDGDDGGWWLGLGLLG